MGIRPSSQSNPTAVTKHIGTAIDAVSLVAENIDSLITIAGNLPASLKYLGSALAPPTVRLDGSAIQDGDFYLDTLADSFFYLDLTDSLWISLDTDGAIAAAASAQISATSAAADALQTGLDKIGTGNDLVATNADAALTNADKVQTSLDLLATNQDTIDTAADRVQTNLDRVATASDKTATNADVLLTEADKVQTGLDRIATNADVVLVEADKVQTGLDKIATNADVVLTHADVVLAEADKVQTGLDRIAVNADKVQTGLDKTATNADVVLTNADVVLTHADVATTNTNVGLTNADVILAEADKVQTGLDRIATAADVVTTGSDVVTTNANVVSTTADALSTASDVVSTNADVLLTHADLVATNADRVAIETLYDNFDDRYLGTKATDPTLDNDGAALLIGAIYFNSATNTTRFYNGVAWEVPEVTSTTAATTATTQAGIATTQASNASSSAATATTQATSATNSASTATTQATNSAVSATASAGSATTATAEAAIATTKAAEASASASSAAADLVLTNADVVLAEADKVQTGLDRIATGADVVLTEADKVQTGLDRVAVAADLVQTTLDQIQTSADRVVTTADKAATNADALTSATKAGEAVISASNALTSANNSADSATSSSTSASTATTQATSATGSASSATASATAAASSATAASSSATASATSATNAESAWDSFDGIYLGSKASAPTLDNDGNALVDGTLYWDSVDNNTYIYNGTHWQLVGSTVNGTSARFEFVATAAQTTFVTPGFDSGYADVYQNGIKLINTVDFDDTDGVNIILTSGANLDDEISVIAYGTFLLADHYSKVISDARYLQLTGGTVTGPITATDFIGPLNGPIRFSAKNTSGGTLTVGQVVYISGVSGNTPTVGLANANDSAKMPAYGLVAVETVDNDPVEIITFGALTGVKTDYAGWALGDTLYVSTTPGTLTNVAPSGESSLIQNLGRIRRLHQAAGSITVGGAGRTNATPNLNDGNVFIGNASNQSVPRALVVADTTGLQTALDLKANQATTYTKIETDTAISNLVAAAPATLDTLNELAAALGDDPNFATTVTNSVALKAPLASPSFTGDIAVTGNVDGRDIAVDGTKLDGIETGATADQTKADIDALNIDADLLDGQHGSYYSPAHSHPYLPLSGGTLTGALDFGSVTGRAITITGDSGLDGSDASIYLGNAPASYGFDITYEGTGSGNTNAFVITSTNTGAPKELFRSNQDGIVNLPQTGAKVAGNAIWHAGNDGPNSGLDADLLDGQHGSYYAPTTSPTFTGAPTAPTAATGTNTTQLATTAFVLENSGGSGGGQWEFISEVVVSSSVTAVNVPTNLTNPTYGEVFKLEIINASLSGYTQVIFDNDSAWSYNPPRGYANWYSNGSSSGTFSEVANPEGLRVHALPFSSSAKTNITLEFRGDNVGYSGLYHKGSGVTYQAWNSTIFHSSGVSNSLAPSTIGISCSAIASGTFRLYKLVV